MWPQMARKVGLNAPASRTNGIAGNISHVDRIRIVDGGMHKLLSDLWLFQLG